MHLGTKVFELCVKMRDSQPVKGCEWYLALRDEHESSHATHNTEKASPSHDRPELAAIDGQEFNMLDAVEAFRNELWVYRAVKRR
jgi:hypothetical protein